MASPEPERLVEIVEVSARDGLQNDAADLPTEVKAELIARAVATGIRRLEVTSFVSPKAVPKMADAEALLEILRSDDSLRDVVLIGLVVNERGVGRALAAGVHEINFVVIASDTFNRRNQGVPTSQTLSELPGLIAAAHAGGARTSVTVGASFGCPFEGEVSLTRLEEVLGPVAGAAPDEISLADTIGVAVPRDVTERIGLLKDVASPGTALRAHFHNTRNTAIASSLAAVDAGIDALDSSLGGLGGCPFAPKATGNVATEDLVYALSRSGVRTGVDLGPLIEASRWLAEAVMHPLPASVSKAALFPPDA